MSNFHPLQVVARGGETQPQVVEKILFGGCKKANSYRFYLTLFYLLIHVYIC